jgi:hypothetical protein
MLSPNYTVICTKETPTIRCSDDGAIFISGVSLPEHPMNFYADFLNWMDDFLASKPKKIDVHFDLRYLNSTSTRIIFNVVRRIKEYNQNNDVVTTVIWEYEEEDDDILELGQEIEMLAAIPFQFKIA